MIELRKNPRANVIWRAAVKLAEGEIIAVKIVNISSGGLLIHCATALQVNKKYHIMMEMPSIDQSSSVRHQAPCKVLAMHVRLSGDFYQIGVKFTEISDLHQALFDAWLSITTKFEQLS
jgi:c-di-GMP-binding flagellar brake protein YcgR